MVWTREVTERSSRPRIQAPPQRGIEPVPVEHRLLGFLDYFALWSSLGVGLLVLLAGTLLVPSLGMGPALVAIVVGTLIGNGLLGLVGLVGNRTGVPTMVLFRPSLGVRGSYLPTFLNVLQLVGAFRFSGRFGKQTKSIRSRGKMNRRLEFRRTSSRRTSI